MNGFPRLERIRYALDASGIAVGAEREVRVTWQVRPDVSVDYRYGQKRIDNERIANIQVLLGGQQIRRYVLGYILGLDNRSSLLDSVTIRGSDDVMTLP